MKKKKRHFRLRLPTAEEIELVDTLIPSFLQRNNVCPLSTNSSSFRDVKRKRDENDVPMPLISLDVTVSAKATTRMLRRLSLNAHQASFSSCRHLSQNSPLNGVPSFPSSSTAPTKAVIDKSHLNPESTEYARSVFQDKCVIRVQAGGGGNGCVSFLREKFIEDGPANGGNGGYGGNIFIQAVEGSTSLHKLARSRMIRAGQGRTGQGKGKGGQKGADVLITVPVGTIVREISRHDPVTEGHQRLRALKSEFGYREGLRRYSHDSQNWVLYPGSQPSDFFSTAFPIIPPPQRTAMAASEPPSPTHLDLSQPMATPILLLAGGIGGLGNPNFVTRINPKPKFASRGERGTRLELELELKMLADVGLVGLPNAGKSTLLRSISNSRTRVGNWAFTTLSPNIGTVVVDNNEGRPLIDSFIGDRRRTNFTIADIPGLIENAHLDRGLGSGFLRHVERAGVLAFVIDLSAGDAVLALKGLWHELNQYQILRDEQLSLETENRPTTWGSTDNDSWSNADDDYDWETGRSLQSSSPSATNTAGKVLPPVYSKPWLVIGTKADKAGSEENFLALRDYLSEVEKGTASHPSGNDNAWHERLTSIPVSAINAEGVDVIPAAIVKLLDGSGNR